MNAITFDHWKRGRVVVTYAWKSGHMFRTVAGKCYSLDISGGVWHHGMSFRNTGINIGRKS